MSKGMLEAKIERKIVNKKIFDIAKEIELMDDLTL